jgi:hypothetical protein
MVMPPACASHVSSSRWRAFPPLRKPRGSAPRPSKKPKLDSAEVKKRGPEDADGRVDDAETHSVPSVKAEPAEASIASLPQARNGAGSGAAAEQLVLCR